MLSTATPREATLHKLLVTITTFAAAAALAAVDVTTNRSDAMTLGDPSGVRGALGKVSVVDTVGYVYGGYRYCWYDDGWSGEGWYVCDYGPWVRGSWFGSGLRGWH